MQLELFLICLLFSITIGFYIQKPLYIQRESLHNNPYKYQTFNNNKKLYIFFIKNLKFSRNRLIVILKIKLIKLNLKKKSQDFLILVNKGNRRKTTKFVPKVCKQKSTLN